MRSDPASAVRLTAALSSSDARSDESGLFPFPESTDLPGSVTSGCRSSPRLFDFLRRVDDSSPAVGRSGSAVSSRDEGVFNLIFSSDKTGPAINIIKEIKAVITRFDRVA